MNRLEKKFTTIKGRPALVTYIMAYAPDKATSLAVLKGLPAAGADIIELGMPFSDPMADGPVIQQAAIKALEHKAKQADVLEMVAEFRKNDTTTPIALMGYYNPIQNYGVEKFTRDAYKAGVDALLVVDIPTEEENKLRPYAEKAGLDWIRLVTPTTDSSRIKTIAKSASGFIYYVSVAGVTGTKSASTGSIGEAVAKIKEHTKLPIAVGFGIKTAQDVKNTGKHADAVVVGSAIVAKMLESKSAKDTLDFVNELAGR